MSSNLQISDKPINKLEFLGRNVDLINLVNDTSESG